VKIYIGRIKLRFLGDKIAASPRPSSVPAMVRFYATDDEDARTFFASYYHHIYAIDLAPDQFIVSADPVTHFTSEERP
jgi:hypothetical protein